jgi:alpha-N-acetylglucosaminidase
MKEAPSFAMLTSINLPVRALFVIFVLLVVQRIGYAAGPENADLQPARAALMRLLPMQARQIHLSVLPLRNRRDAFRISGTAGHIEVAGTTNVAALFGVNWYLKYVAHLQISTNGDQLAWRGELPAPPSPIERATPYTYRYALNENTDGYSTPYWGWTRWQREIDVLAFSGINAVLVERGMDGVVYQTLRDFGYSSQEAREWITQPAHQNWELMGNMCCFDEPISRQLLARRVRSARRIIARLRELGITPVLPGYYGLVPADFASKHPGSHVIAQGTWNGFQRPGWLDPRDPLFASVAASFYRHERELFGDSSIYDIEAFQEGGTPGGVPVSSAARSIQEALNGAHPGASWMTLAWQGNPSPALLSGIDPSRLLVVDLDQGRTPHESREKDFRGAPYLFGGLWEFGGRTTLGANLYDYAVRLPRMGVRPSSKMAGTALFSEGLDTNPMAFDLFTEMAWRTNPVDLLEWSANYARRRYGSDDAHARRAWQILMQTVYGGRADGVSSHGERDAAPESLFDAQPTLTAKSASSWAPDELRYDPNEFNQALTELLEASPSVQATETYRYDLVDVARQALANWSRSELPCIANAYAQGDEPRFRLLTDRWLRMMLLQDALLGTNRFFLLGPWLDAVSPWAADHEERRRLQYDARSILTTWGNRAASEAGLHDYGNRDWAGLTRDYYRRRWQLYFETIDRALRMGTKPKSIDWFQFGQTWNRENTQYATRPRGDAYAIAKQIARELEIASFSTAGSDLPVPAVQGKVRTSTDRTGGKQIK